MRRILSLAVAGIVVLALASDAGAGVFRPRVRVRYSASCGPGGCSVQYRASASSPSPSAGPGIFGYDLGSVNACRARHGLRPLVHDAALAAAAARNNAVQAARGLGHFVLAGAQCAAGTDDPGYAAAMWERSPAHAAIMLDPSATVAGVAFGGGYATLNVLRR